jgi:flagellar protein FlbT
VALKVELKPHEKIVIGSVIIQNGETRARLLIEGEAAILRERDIIGAAEAESPAKRIYFVLQLMYLDQDVVAHKNAFIELIDAFMQAAPSAWPIISKITDHVISGDIYRAIKATRALIDYEEEITNHELRNERLSKDSPDGNKPKAA